MIGQAEGQLPGDTHIWFGLMMTPAFALRGLRPEQFYCRNGSLSLALACSAWLCLALLALAVCYLDGDATHDDDHNRTP